MKRIVVLGAGPTGLGAGYRLRETEYDDWDVYEMNPHVGGLSASFRDERGFTWDIGGHIIFSHYPYYDRLIERLLGSDVCAHERESWVRLMGTFVRYPFQNNFHFLPEDVVLECIMGLIEARENNRSVRTFEDWILKMFGEGIAKYFLVPYNLKVWSHPLTAMDYGWIGERVSVVDIRHVMRNIVYRKDDSSWGPNNEFLFPRHGGTGALFEAFVPFLADRLHLSSRAMAISLDSRTVTFENGARTGFDVLLSTIPADELVRISDPVPPEVRDAAKHLKKAGGYIVGVGIARPCPSDKNWMYFPEGNCPFYRVTYLSNYSPNMTPGGEFYSLLCETSFSSFKAVRRETIVDETVDGKRRNTTSSRRISSTCPISFRSPRSAGTRRYGRFTPFSRHGTSSPGAGSAAGSTKWETWTIPSCRASSSSTGSPGRGRSPPTSPEYSISPPHG
jgi:protoporphyrinogen oxidase